MLLNVSCCALGHKLVQVVPIVCELGRLDLQPSNHSALWFELLKAEVW